MSWTNKQATLVACEGPDFLASLLMACNTIVVETFGKNCILSLSLWSQSILLPLMLGLEMISEQVWLSQERQLLLVQTIFEQYCSFSFADF